MASIDSVEIARFGPTASPIIVSLSNYQGRKLIDIRKYYVEKSSKELKPTQKGISLSAEQLSSVLMVLARNQNKIGDWLALPVKDDKQNKSPAMAKLHEDFTLASLRVDQRYLTDRSLYRRDAQGGSDALTLNEGHPFIRSALNAVSALSGNDDDQQDKAKSAMLDILGALFFSLERAVELSVNAGGAKDAGFWETTRFTWQLLMSAYSPRVT
jgi:hypothetical protein